MAGCDGVLDHPFLTAIVEAARSASAADEYVQRLGWGKSLGRQMRNAVHLYQRYSSKDSKTQNIWEELKATEVHPLDAMYEFVDVDPKIGKGFQVQTHQKAGCESYEVNQPLLARELRQGDRSTGLAGENYGRLWSDEKWLLGICTSWPTYVMRFNWPKKLDLIEEHDAIGSVCNPGQMVIDFAPAYSLPNPDTGYGWPKYYRVLRITKRPPDPKANWFERIWLWMRLGLGPDCYAEDIGEMKYERIISYDPRVDVEPNGSWAITAVLFKVYEAHGRNQGWILSSADLDNYANITRGRVLWRPGGPSKSYGSVADELTVLAAKLDSFEQCSMESVFGESLVTNPPETLIDLFERY